jgi:hypothetical protein
MTKPTQPPGPGIYENVPPEIYFLWDAVSNSRLNLMARSPAHYNAGFQGEPTPAMSFGTLVHDGVLEPLSIIQRNVFEPDWSLDERNTTSDGARSFSSATKFVREQKAKFRELHRDKKIVSESDYNKMVGIATTLSNCEVMRGLMSAGKPEVSIVFDDPETGLRCKSRCDWLRVGKGGSVLLDLKTTADASEFERSILKYGYSRQLAFYRRAVELSTGERPAVWICAIETQSPFGHRVATLAAETLAIGEHELDELLQRVAECQASDTWPGYAHPDAWRLPEWYRRSQPVELQIGSEVLEVGGAS